MRFEVHDSVTTIVVPGAIGFEEMAVVPRDERMDAPIAESETRLRKAPELDEVIAAVRAMYRRFGLDPTKTRPSSEALLRRVRRGEGLPRINSVVDVCNWCSLETQLPFGLYDVDRIEGDVVLRLGAAGEGYEGIRKDRVNVAGRLTLADERGPFGNPTSDSARTMVTLETRRALFVIFAPRAVGAAVRERALALTADRVRKFAGGVESFRA